MFVSHLILSLFLWFFWIFVTFLSILFFSLTIIHFMSTKLREYFNKRKFDPGFEWLHILRFYFTHCHECLLICMVELFVFFCSFFSLILFSLFPSLSVSNFSIINVSLFLFHPLSTYLSLSLCTPLTRGRENSHNISHPSEK